MKQRLKQAWFRLQGKDPEAVVVHFWSGPRDLAARMTAEVRQLVPDRRHIVVTIGPGGDIALDCTRPLGPQLRLALRPYRIGLAPVLFAGGPHPLRSLTFRIAPFRVLAYNAQLERHHIHPRSWIASVLFLRGVPLDRIFLRPKWLAPWKRDRSVTPAGYRTIEGRPETPGRRRIAVLTPYSPYPLSHGGAVRIYHLLREAARDFDVVLFTFGAGETDDDYGVLAGFCSRVVIAGKPRYREPRWSTLLPPEVHEFESPAMREALRAHRYDLLQVEYTQLARYGGDILVEHDVTYDLFGQVLRRERRFGAWWDFFRWRRFETGAVHAYRRVVAMSDKDAALLGKPAHVRVIENGVDLERFEPEPEPCPGAHVLFVGSFRHFPNVEAYRFLIEQVWPAIRERCTLTIVAGPDWERYLGADPPQEERIVLHGFVKDVKPLYAACNLVVVPTVVSAGTNLKVLEAMAMERAVVSTPSGCAGLGLEHGQSVWIAATAQAFAAAILRALDNPAERRRIARNARRIAEQRFDWRAIGEKQRSLYGELLSKNSDAVSRG